MTREQHIAEAQRLLAGMVVERPDGTKQTLAVPSERAIALSQAHSLIAIALGQQHGRSFVPHKPRSTN